MKNNLEKAFNFIDNKSLEMRELWENICKMESYSYDFEEIDKVQEFLQKQFSNAGMETKIYDFEGSGNSLVASYKVESDIPGVAFMGHVDTVHKKGRFGENPVKIEDGIIYGPGVLDCKGGVVVGFLAAQALKHIGIDREIKLVYSGDEEIQHSTSLGKGADVFLNEVKGFAAAFDCETGFVDGRIAVGRKGGAVYRIKITGKGAHAGNEPQNGISAIKEAAHKSLNLEKLTNYDGITYNIGVIKGGTVANSIPADCELEIDVRFRTNKDVDIAKKVLEDITNKSYVEGTTAILETVSLMHPMEKTEGNMRLFELVKQASLELGFVEPKECVLGGASDAAYSVMAGVPTVCAMGVRGYANHTLEERAVVSSLEERAKLLVATVLNMPKDFK